MGTPPSGPYAILTHCVSMNYRIAKQPARNRLGDYVALTPQHRPTFRSPTLLESPG